MKKLTDNLNKLFSKSKPLNFRIKQTEDDKNYVFLFAGEKNEVHKRFLDLLACLANEKIKIDFYQIDNEFATTHPKQAQYKIGIGLEKKNNLAKVMSYIRQTVDDYELNLPIAVDLQSSAFPLELAQPRPEFNKNNHKRNRFCF